MFSFTDIPVALLIMGSVFAAFACFIIFTMSYLRYYFNRYEPVYTLSDNGQCEKNHIASRFCKIILSNTVTDQCLTDVENIGLWMMVSNIIIEWDDNDILSINELHSNTLLELKCQLDENQYEKIATNFIKLELAIDSNLMKSKIATPPYLRGSTYAVWITRVLSTLNKS